MIPLTSQVDSSEFAVKHYQNEEQVKGDVDLRAYASHEQFISVKSPAPINIIVELACFKPSGAVALGEVPEGANHPCVEKSKRVALYILG
jgi:hypothetical protein